MKWVKIYLGILLAAIASGSLAQTQYQNRVVVIPMAGEDSTWRGPWAMGETYKRSDVVEDGGSSYIAIIKHDADLTNIPPDASYWELIAASGSSGAKGDKGDDGEKGDMGDDGAAGVAGAAGAKGDKGDTGAAGLAGAAGAKGDKGDTGAAGLAGAAGAKGDKGDTGAAGLAGAAGAKGDKGDTGSPGAAGTPGMNGADGAKGDKGDTGAAGADGNQIAVDGTTIFETVPDLTKPDEKVINGIVYTAGANIVISTPDATKPDEKVIRFSQASPTGSYDNYHPSLAINYIIALYGTFPSRSSIEGMIGQISMFAGNFAPRSWAFCEGQLLSISENSALFSIVGTFYGGDGRSTFGLPDLRGRSPVHKGTGPGLPSRAQGEKFGRATIQL